MIIEYTGGEVCQVDKLPKELYHSLWVTCGAGKGGEIAMARRESKTTPKIHGGVLYNDSGSFSVGSKEWWTWISQDSVTTFYVESNTGTYTARIEPRSGSFYWYAFRKHQGKLYKVYIGRTEDLTLGLLLRTCQELNNKIRTV